MASKSRNPKVWGSIKVFQLRFLGFSRFRVPSRKGSVQGQKTGRLEVGSKAWGYLLQSICRCARA